MYKGRVKHKMKVVILAGGLPSAIADDWEGIPKPMVEIGERPLLWHIMKLYAHYGYKDFIICTGFKGDMIKRYFMDYYIYQSDITIDLETNRIHVHKKKTEDWSVTVVDTGLQTPAFTRIGQIMKYIQNEPFIVTYGDCISDIHVDEMVDRFYKDTLTALMAVSKPTGRHRLISVEDNGNLTAKLMENKEACAWVDACTMVLSPAVFPYLEGAESQIELFRNMDAAGNVGIYRHNGFWRAVETMRDRREMESLWLTGMPPWKVWQE